MSKEENLHIEEKGAVQHHDCPDTDLKAHLSRTAAAAELSDARNPWQVLKGNPRSVFIMTAVLCTSIINGIELSMNGNMLGSQAFCRMIGRWVASSDEYEVPAPIVSGLAGAAWPFQYVGTFLAGWLGDRYGRRPVIQFSMAFMLVGAIIEVTTTKWPQWMVAKMVNGVATGAVTTSAAAFVAEVAPRELRAGVLSLYTLMNNLGSLLSSVILDVSIDRWPDTTSHMQFKIPLYIMIALPVVLAAGMVFVPESPTWLVMHSRMEGAEKSLRTIYPNMDHEEIALELAKIKYTLAKEEEARTAGKPIRWIECFRGTNMRRTLIAISGQAAYQQAGDAYYLQAAYYFSVAGFHNSLQATVIVQCVCMLSNFVAMLLSDSKSVGRRRLLTTGIFLQATGMLAIGIIGTIWYPSPGESAVGSKLFIVLMIVGVVGAQLGPNTIGYIYQVEAPSSQLRAKTAAIAQIVQTTLSHLAGIYTPYLTSTTAYAKWSCKTGYFFAAWGYIFFLAIYLYVPDLTGRSTAQIDELFARGIKARKFRETVCTGDYDEDEDA